jgi:hypothetical protein
VIVASFSRTAYRTLVSDVQPSRRSASSSSLGLICSPPKASLSTCPLRTKIRCLPEKKCAHHLAPLKAFKGELGRGTVCRHRLSLLNQSK